MHKVCVAALFQDEVFTKLQPQQNICMEAIYVQSNTHGK